MVLGWSTVYTPGPRGLTPEAVRPARTARRTIRRRFSVPEERGKNVIFTENISKCPKACYFSRLMRWRWSLSDEYDFIKL